MTFDLKKGEKFSLSKNKKAVNGIEVQLFWTTKASKDIDLDVSVFMLDKKNLLVRDYLLYFNKQSILDGLVFHGGDNKIGNSRNEPDETVKFTSLENIPDEIEKAWIAVSVHEPVRASINDIKSGRLVIRDLADNEILLTYELPNFNKQAEQVDAIVVGELYRNVDSWEFKALEDKYAYTPTQQKDENSLQLIISNT